MYDSLPPELRKWFQNHVLNLTPVQAYQMRQFGSSVPSIIHGGNEYFRTGPYSTRAVYGPHHPEA